MRIALYSCNDLESRAISWWTYSPYCHCSLVLDDDSLIEAYPGVGVRTRPNYVSGRKPGNIVDLFKFNVPFDDQTALEFANRQLGKKYSWPIIARFITHTAEERIKSNSWICSELVYCVCQKGGVDLLSRIDPWLVTPRDVSISSSLTFCQRVVVSS